jgi:hypothetical protein
LESTGGVEPGWPRANMHGRIAEIEEKIGAGLIEEVIEVANGELKLARTMAEHKV